jgi:hypothetical protein
LYLHQATKEEEEEEKTVALQRPTGGHTRATNKNRLNEQASTDTDLPLNDADSGCPASFTHLSTIGEYIFPCPLHATYIVPIQSYTYACAYKFQNT